MDGCGRWLEVTTLMFIYIYMYKEFVYILAVRRFGNLFFVVAFGDTLVCHALI